MFERQIWGIHLTDSAIAVSSFKRGLKGWTHSQAIKRSAILHGAVVGGLEALEALLSRYRPSRRRKICVTIPHDRLYLRELPMPNLSVEEAEESARLSISLHSHLPPEDIYFDVLAFSRHGTTFVLLAYIRRQYIDNIVSIFKKTGHFRSLYILAPLMQGVDAFLRQGSRIAFPCLSITRHEGAIYLGLHGEGCWQGGHAVDGPGADHGTESGSSGLGRVMELLPAPYGDEGIKRYLLGIEPGGAIAGDNPLEDPALAELSGGGQWGPGLAAAALGMNGSPALNLVPGRKMRRRRRSRLDPIRAVAALAAGMMALLTIFYGGQAIWLYSRYVSNERSIKELEERLAPFKSIQSRLDKTRKTEALIEAFMDAGPPALAVIDELAKRIPRDAWVRNCSIRADRVRISVEGGSAVSVVEELKKSPLFKDVSLVSSVTRTRDQKERYTLELKLGKGAG